MITALETVQRRNVCVKRWDLTAQKNALVLVELKHRELYQVDFRSFVMKRGTSTSQSNAPSPNENTPKPF